MTRLIGSPQISTQRLAELCRRVGMSIDAGIDLRKIWTQEAQRGAILQRRQIERIRSAVADGESLSDGVNATGQYFPQLFHEMIHVGEQAGRLDQVLLRMADHYDHQLALRRTFLAGIAWPIIELALAVCVVGILILVMGYVGQMTGQSIDLLGWGLVGVQGLVVYAMFVAAICFLLFFLVRSWMRGMIWTAPLQRAALQVPGLGPALRTLALSRMAWTLALTTNTSLDIRRALDLSQRSTHNAHFARHIPDVERYLTDGKQIHTALRDTRAYPDDFVEAVQVGEESGQLPEAMEKLSEQYLDRSRAALGILTVLAGVAVLILVGFVILLLAARILLTGIIGPYRELLDEVSMLLTS